MHPPDGFYAPVVTRVHRPRLLSQLDQGSRHKLTLICANAGYGKTSLMSDYLQSRKLRAVWLTLTPSHKDTARLVDALESELRTIVPSATPSAGDHYSAPDMASPSLQLLCKRLQGLLAQVGQGRLLVILDDYQNIEQEDVANYLLGSLIQNSPAGVHFIILSRGAPRFPTGRLKARQEVYTIDEHDLAFTREEVEQFFRQSGYPVEGQSVIDLLLGRTEGWAAGIAMVCQAFKDGRQDRAMEVLADPTASAWLVFDYMAEEVFGQETALLQDFLVRTSVLTVMTPDACSYLLDSGSSRMTLLDLEQRGLFTTSIDPGRERFRYHQLFREFLLQKLYQSGPSVTNSLHLKAARYFEKRAEWDDCVQHYLRAGQPIEAARVAEAVGLNQILSGFPDTVKTWLDALPTHIQSTRPQLLALQGRLSASGPNPEEPLRWLEKALRLFKSAGDDEGQAWALLEIAIIERRRRRLDRAIHLQKAALELARPGTMVRGGLLAYLGASYRLAGMLTESATVLRSAIDELSAIDDDVARAWCYSLALPHLALTLVQMGEIGEALRNVRAGLAFSESSQKSEYDTYLMRGGLGHVLWSTGDFSEAIPLLTRARSSSALHGSDAFRYTSLWLGNCLRDTGDWSKAEEMYAASTPKGEVDHAFLSILRGDSLDAMKRVSLLSPQLSQTEAIYDRVGLDVVLAGFLRELGQHEQALAQLRAASALLTERRCVFLCAGVLLHRARIEYESGMPGEGRQSLAQAFEFASSQELYQFPWWDSQLVAYLCQQAIEDEVFPEYAAELARRRLDAKSLAPLASLITDPRANVRKNAAAALSSLSQQDSASTIEQILSGCSDSLTRAALHEALRQRLVRAEGLRTLRSQFGLTWREVEVFLEYYTRPASSIAGTEAQRRSDCAKRLNLSENTLRCHVNKIRGKLGLPRSVSGRAVLVWAREQGVLAEKYIDSGKTPTAL